MKTLRLYQQDPYMKECDAALLRLLATEEECASEGRRFEKGTALALLDRTLFFPEGGGQPWDLGTVGGAAITEVLEDKKTGLVWHRLKAGEALSRLKEGETVHCVLDWQRRFDHMQMHCGEHVLSGCFMKLWGIENRGFHMGSGFVTIDMAIPEGSPLKEITPEMLIEAELAANEAVWADLPVVTRYYDTREEANSQPVRKEIKFDEDISVVFIGEGEDMIDCCACCGTHPSSTGQVGSVRILKSEKYKGMLRLHCRMGRQALLDAMERTRITTNLCREYSSELPDLEARMAAANEKNGAMRKELYDLKKDIQANEARALRPLISEKPVFKSYPSMTSDDLQAVCHLLEKELKGLIALSSEKENTVILASGGTPHCGNLVREYASFYKGKGGGSPKLARAIFTNKEDMELFCDLIEKHLR
ncbi:MAG: hypothetical protein IJM17_01925 [Firmicutes bacterium]|nr:hypothetical protein [Bacillota bacterium]